MNATRITTAFAAVVAAVALGGTVAHANEPGEPGYYNDTYMAPECRGPVDRAVIEKELQAEAREATMLKTIQNLQNEVRLLQNGVAII